ncbi:gas vesicle protein [Streptomyces sp. A10(2020)]|uniref:gas vesicle protein GvpO n=1 Tax=Streptomyces sp. A10(2020) TaxID=2782013 RepID=UPI001F5D9AD9|nr:gas vesicle protein [Streptomyces sp. A10(2020)]UNR59134.1 gas vesicle protein [Streptomyces sp. A10(2020)]
MAEQRTRPARRSTASEGSRTEPARGARGAAERACEGLADLIGHRTEGVSAVRKAEEHPGWRVDVDVLEVPRIPDTTSLLATYEVELDGDGELLEYRRVRRYRRGAADS